MVSAMDCKSVHGGLSLALTTDYSRVRVSRRSLDTIGAILESMMTQ